MASHYDRALKALQAAHEATYRAWEKDPKRNPIGMSTGPFSGVNEALGIIKELELELDAYRRVGRGRDRTRRS